MKERTEFFYLRISHVSPIMERVLQEEVEDGGESVDPLSLGPAPAFICRDNFRYEQACTDSL
jgi:hypothetical protein